MAGKIITIDWPTIAALPSDEYHIKLLNKQQAAVLQALCEYQHWETRWDNLELSKDELDRFMGDIEFRLMGDETGGFMTVEELIEGVCGGLVCAAPKIGAMLATGITKDFAIDEDGNVSLPSDDNGGAELPEDDETTPIDETLASKAGGAKACTDGVQKILSDMFTWYASGTITSQMAEDRLVLLYQFEPEKAAIFANYWYTVYMNSQGTVLISQSLLDGYFFCKGISVATLAEYVYYLHSVALEVPVLEILMENFPVGMFDVWYAQGSQIYDSDYATYPCTKIPTEEFTLNFALLDSFTIALAGTWKDGHRYLIEADGSFADADVPNVVKDFFWSHNTSTGVKTFENFVLNISGTNAKTSAEVPFQSNHKYAVTYEKVGDDGGNFAKNNGEFTLPNVVGTITVKITDLGWFKV